MGGLHAFRNYRTSQNDRMGVVFSGSVVVDDGRLLLVLRLAMLTGMACADSDVLSAAREARVRGAGGDASLFTTE